MNEDIENLRHEIERMDADLDKHQTRLAALEKSDAEQRALIADLTEVSERIFAEFPPPKNMGAGADRWNALRGLLDVLKTKIPPTP